MMHDVILLYSKISICIRDLFLYRDRVFSEPPLCGIVKSSIKHTPENLGF